MITYSFRDELWLIIILHCPFIFLSTDVATPFRFTSDLSFAIIIV